MLGTPHRDPGAPIPRAWVDTACEMAGFPDLGDPLTILSHSLVGIIRGCLFESCFFIKEKHILPARRRDSGAIRLRSQGKTSEKNQDRCHERGHANPPSWTSRQEAAASECLDGLVFEFRGRGHFSRECVQAASFLDGKLGIVMIILVFVNHKPFSPPAFRVGGSVNIARMARRALNN